MNKTKAVFEVINHNLATIHGTMDIDRITDCLITLCNVIHQEPETDWSLGEYGEFTLDSLIVGAYWFYTDYHGGQNSKEYVALSELGSIFLPGMSCLDREAPEFDAYILLEQLRGEKNAAYNN